MGLPSLRQRWLVYSREGLKQATTDSEFLTAEDPPCFRRYYFALVLPGLWLLWASLTSLLECSLSLVDVVRRRSWG